MWSRSSKVVGLGLGIGTSWFALKKFDVVGIVEAGGKPPYPPQSHCMGKECPRTKWDNDWDKKEGEEAARHSIIIVAHGQADNDNSSGKNKNAAKPQKVANKGKNVQVQKLPSDPRRFIKPKEVANEDVDCIDPNSGAPAAGGNGGEGIEGLSPLGMSQAKALVAFFNDELWGVPIKTIVHGTDPPSTATAKMIENAAVETKAKTFANIETTMLDPLTPPLPGQDDEDPHPGDSARLEAVYRKYFYRLLDDGASCDELDVIVCPPKMVGYFVCRFLQIPPDRFTSWSIANGSFTELVIYPNGRVGVHRVGDIGFMAPKDVTYE